jgi:hypothetical protein
MRTRLHLLLCIIWDLLRLDLQLLLKDNLLGRSGGRLLEVFLA